MVSIEQGFCEYQEWTAPIQEFKLYSGSNREPLNVFREERDRYNFLKESLATGGD